MSPLQLQVPSSVSSSLMFRNKTSYLHKEKQNYIFVHFDFYVLCEEELTEISDIKHSQKLYFMTNISISLQLFELHRI
jgi:hypothetical protein